VIQILVTLFADHFEIAGEQKVIFEFARRSQSYIEEPVELTVSSLATSFGEVGSD
jgi:hypothetical protein